MKDEISIWDIPLNKIFVLLEPKFRYELLNICLEIAKKLPFKVKGNKSADKLALWLDQRAKHYQNVRTKIYGRDIHHWRKGEQWISYKRRKIKKKNKIPVYIPLWCLKELSTLVLQKNLKFSMKNIEKHIFAYRVKGGIPIKPIYRGEHKLPVKVSPVFTSLLFHMLGDGCDTSGIPYYSQKNLVGLKRFKEKIHSVFGSFDTSPNKKNFMFPTTILYFFKEYFNIKSFSWDKGVVPPKIFLLDRMHKVSALFSFLIDEGSVSDQIAIHSGNKKLLDGVRELAINLGYRCMPIKRERTSFFFRISTDKSNFNRLIADLEELTKNYPVCDFAHKQIKIDILKELQKIEVYPYGIRYNTKLVQKLILEKILPLPRSKISSECIEHELPSDVGFTTSEIQNILWKDHTYLITLQKVRRFLKELSQIGSVKNLFFHNRFYVWGLPEHPMINSPYDIIIDALKDNPLTLREISMKLKLPYDFVEYRVRKILVKSGVVKPMGVKLLRDKWNRQIKNTVWGIVND